MVVSLFAALSSPVWAASDGEPGRPLSMDAMQVACVQFENTADVVENARRMIAILEDESAAGTRKAHVRHSEHPILPSRLDTSAGVRRL